MDNKIIRYDGKNVDLFNYLDLFVKSPIKLMQEFMNEGHFSIARTKRHNMLKNVLQKTVQQETDELLEKKEENENKLGLVDKKRYERLLKFDSLSETQLENELYNYKNDKVLFEYKEDLWVLVLKEAKAQKVKDDIFGYLLDSVDESPSQIETIHDISEAMNLYFHDPEGTLDGLQKDSLPIILNQTSHVAEITKIGAKYGVTIPKTLNKPMFQKLLEQTLSKKNKLTDALKAKIEAGKIKDLDQIANREGVSISSYMNKEMAIEFLMDNAKFIEPITGDKPKKKAFADEALNEHEILASLKDLQESIQTLSDKLDSHIENSTKIANKQKPTISKLQLILYIVLGFLFLLFVLSTAAYRYPDNEPFNTLIRILNSIRIREYGVMDLYHRLIRFILHG